MKRGLEGIETLHGRGRRRRARASARRRAASRRLEACQSPIWDTALAIIALSDAGLPGDHPALVRAGALAARRGGHACAATGRSQRPAWRPAAGPSSSRTSTTPTSTTRPRSCCALERLGGRGARRARRRRSRARRRLGGGHAELRRRLGRVRRRQHPRARARAAVPGLRRGDRRAERRRDRAHDRDARRCSAAASEPATRGRACAGCSSTRRRTAPGTGAGGSTTSTARARPCPAWSPPACHPPSAGDPRAPCGWLERHQNEDGGWGEDARSYDDPRWIGRGPSTASQTAWALLALHAAGERGEAMARGVAWLVATQRPDGGWDEPQYTGTGFPCDYYINYHLYRISFPLMALGRCLASARAASRGASGRTAAAAQAERTARRGADVRGLTRAGRAAGNGGRHRGRPLGRGGDGACGGRELPGRQPPAAARRSASTCSPSTASRAWSTSSATRSDAPGDRLAALDWLEGELDRAYAGRATHPLMVRLQPTDARRAGSRASRSSG